MREIERTKSYIDELINIEDLITNYSVGLNDGSLNIGDARKQISGLEKNLIITKLNPSYMYDNPYIKNIHIDNWLVGNVYLTNLDKHEAYTVNAYEMRSRDPKSLTTIFSYFYFPETIHYPSLGTIFPDSKWMGVEPSEISSFAPFIKEAHGKILVMGCGLGYLAYMLSIKDNVDKVTIVELDPKVKLMFETYLKPQMNSKIEIIEADALEFLDVEDISQYDYCSVDIWYGAMDLFEIYPRLLLLEQKHKRTKFHYWLEEDLHVVLERIWMMLIQRKLNGQDICNDLKLFTDILNSQNIETVEGVKSFLHAPKREIVTKWALDNPEYAVRQKSLVQSIRKLK